MLVKKWNNDIGLLWRNASKRVPSQYFYVFSGRYSHSQYHHHNRKDWAQEAIRFLCITTRLTRFHLYTVGPIHSSSHKRVHVNARLQATSTCKGTWSKDWIREGPSRLQRMSNDYSCCGLLLQSHTIIESSMGPRHKQPSLYGFVSKYSSNDVLTLQR